MYEEWIWEDQLQVLPNRPESYDLHKQTRAKLKHTIHTGSRKGNKHAEGERDTDNMCTRER